MRLGHSGGFSLIELMIVVAIIGVLSTVAVPSYTDYVKRSAFARELTLVDQYKKAISLCFQTLGDLSVCSAQDSNSGIPPNFSEGMSNNKVSLRYVVVNQNTIRLIVTLFGQSPDGTAYIRDFYYYDIPSGQWSLDLASSNCDDIGYC